MRDLDVLEDPSVAVAALDPLRARILTALAEPGSASTVAASLGLTRQQVNYHLRLLEEHGLVELVEERPRRGLTERVVRASARGYVVAPPNLGRDGAEPAGLDRLSRHYLIALAARAVREVAALGRRADKANQALPTLAIDTEIRFGSPAARAAFTRELTETVVALTARYHDEQTPGGRQFRLLAASYPRPADHARSTP